MDNSLRCCILTVPRINYCTCMRYMTNTDDMTKVGGKWQLSERVFVSQALQRCHISAKMYLDVQGKYVFSSFLILLNSIMHDGFVLFVDCGCRLVL
jgi:hypothetical protein